MEASYIVNKSSSSISVYDCDNESIEFIYDGEALGFLKKKGNR